MEYQQFRAVLFDWGNTLMQDDPSQPAAMAVWPQVHRIAGADALLGGLHERGLKLALATGALVSDEAEIRAALARVQLDQYLDKIYCHSNSGLRKPSTEFYQHILDDLRILPDQALMVGDSYASDVLAPNQLGIPAIWYNPHGSEVKYGPLCSTVHSLVDLLARFEQAN